MEKTALQKTLLHCLAALLLMVPGAMADEVTYKARGSAWAEAGRIMGASDSLIENSTLNLEGNMLQSLGAQFTLFADFSDHLKAAVGFGAHKVNHALGHGQKSFMAISLYQSFVSRSSLTWYTGDKHAPDFSVTIGAFPYKYHSQVSNLGLYLMRGPVYPGVLMGGFGDFYTDTTKSPLLGARVHHAAGNFSHDLILNSERDIPPTFDFSLVYAASYRLLDMLEVGGGVNFYRLIPYNRGLMTPGKLDETILPSWQKDPYIEVDTSVNPVSNVTSLDTTYFTHRGIKLMGRFSLDLKPLAGADPSNKNDLILYGETALIGLENHGRAYGKRSERLPVMLGFTFPTFGIVDRVSAEVEWYGCRYKQDLARVGNNNVVADWTTQSHPIPSPKPVDYALYGIGENGIYVNGAGDSIDVKGTAMDVENLTEDNWKWSVTIEKTVRNHIRFQAQIASDHYRPRPAATGLIFSEGGTAPAFSSFKDWYFMFRGSFFF